MRRRPVPVVETCKAIGCEEHRRRRDDFCEPCFRRLPVEMRRGIAAARSEHRYADQAGLMLKARTWLHEHPLGSIAEDVAREGAEQRARWCDR